MDAHPQAAQDEQIHADLIAHLGEIPTAKAELQSLTASPTSPTDTKGLSGTGAKSRFIHKMAAPFKFAQQPSMEHTTKVLIHQKEVQLLLEGRRESGSSDRTLVEGEDLASRTLAVLAPLVAGLQKLTPRVVSVLPAAAHLAELFDNTCVEVLRLIGDLEDETSQGGEEDEHDEHDIEMRQLMLSALTKKVEKERDVCHKSLLQSKTFSKSPTRPKSICPSTQNPFILHSASIGLSRPSTGAKAVGVPIQPNPFTNATTQSFSSFAGGPQLTSMNTLRGLGVVRLGAFQSSMLFSPSPIAVKRAVGGRTRL